VKKYYATNVTLRALFLLLFLTACTIVIEAPKTPFTGYQPREKINLRVGLNLTDEFCNAKWEKKRTGDTWIIPIGNALCMNADTLSHQLFGEVILIGQTPNQENSGVDVILTPRLAYITHTRGATSFGKCVVSIKIEWLFTDIHGKTIWVDTVGGQGIGTQWTGHKKLVKGAVENLFKKSYEAISSSREIRKFAGI
jgi:hypothetical protein